MPASNSATTQQTSFIPSTLALNSATSSKFTAPPSKTKLKRKRFAKDRPNQNNSYYDSGEYNEQADEEEEDDDDAHSNYDSNLADVMTDSGSNHSAVSVSSSSSGSFLMKPCKIKHGHKILVTEEKINEALKDLQIEIDNIESDQKEPTTMSTSTALSTIASKQRSFDFNYQDDENEFDDEQQQQAGILISDELKKKLHEFRYQNMLMASSGSLNNSRGCPSLDIDARQMQLVLWSPQPAVPCFEPSEDEIEAQDELNSSFNSNTSTLPDMAEAVGGSLGRVASSLSLANSYKVEEPCDLNKKNRLKRKFSQLNKIQIEEMMLNSNQAVNNNSAQATPSATFYLVDDNDDAHGEVEESEGRSKDSEFLNKLDLDSNSKRFEGDEQPLSTVTIVELSSTTHSDLNCIPQVNSEEQMEF
jgi:hypothetical protein